jgi:hypothetical protein
MEPFKNLLLKNHRAKGAHIYMRAFWYNVDSSLFKSWSPGVGRGHSRVKHIYVCFNGIIFQNLFKKPMTPKNSFFYKLIWCIVKILKSCSRNGWGHNKEKVILHVFMWEILANMTEVSDVATGPLVIYNQINANFTVHTDWTKLHMPQTDPT